MPEINPIDTHISNSTMQVAERSIILAATGAVEGFARIIGKITVEWIYDMLYRPAALSTEDEKNYDELVQIYRSTLGNTYNIPEFWILTTDKRPTFSLNYNLEICKTRDNIEALITKKSGEYLARASILSLLMRFLESMSKRSGWVKPLDSGAVRSDGVELMFILEMLNWFRSVLPELNKEDLIDVLQKRINYCKAIKAAIAKNHSFLIAFSLDGTRANFKDLLDRLSEQFGSYCDFLVQRSSIIRFNDLINVLGDQLSELSALSFHLMHLLIRDVHQPYLIVEQYLSPYPSDKKVIALKKKKLGIWLEQTLLLPGIKDSTFELKLRLTLTKIQKHLEHESPSDALCNLDGSLINPLSDEWGHWSFVTSSKDPERTATDYINKIREFLIAILDIYFVRQNMVRSATVASVFGEVWIYGDRVGKVVLEELLDSIINAIDDYSFKLNSFWDKYYQHYLDYAKENRIDDRNNLAHKWLTEHINLKFKPTIQSLIDAIKLQVNAIDCHSKTLPAIREETKKIKQELFQDLLDFMSYKKKKSTVNYQIIKDALVALELEHLDVEIDKSQLSTIITLPSRAVAQSSSNMSKAKTSHFHESNWKSVRGIFNPLKKKASSIDLSINNDVALDILPPWNQHIQLPGRIHPVKGDGNCFFSAVAFELNRQTQSELTHQIVRQKAVSYLRDNPTLLQHYKPEQQTAESYLEDMEKIGVWAHGPIIDAVAKKYKIHLSILDIREDEQASIFPLHINDGEHSICTVGLVRYGMHYTVLEFQQKKETPYLQLENADSKASAVTLHPCSVSPLPIAKIPFQKGELAFFEGASLVLGSYVIMDPILAKKAAILLEKPEKFYTPLQQYIYDHFLTPNCTIVQNSIAWSVITYGVYSATIYSLISLFKQINAAMLIIYKYPYNSAIKSTSLEMVLLDERFYKVIMKVFNEHKLPALQLPTPDSPFRITTNFVGDIELEVETHKIGVVKESLNQIAETLVSNIHEQRNINAALKKELEDEKVLCVQKDEQLLSKDLKIEDKDREIELKDREIELKDRDLNEANIKIAQLMRQVTLLKQIESKGIGYSPRVFKSISNHEDIVPEHSMSQESNAHV